MCLVFLFPVVSTSLVPLFSVGMSVCLQVRSGQVTECLLSLVQVHAHFMVKLLQVQGFTYSCSGFMLCLMSLSL